MDAAVTCQVLTLNETDYQIARAALSSLGKDGPCPVMKQKKPIKNKWMKSIVSSAGSMKEFHRRGRRRERGGREHPKGQRVGVKTGRPIKETRGSR